jgi:uncharacterized protein
MPARNPRLRVAFAALVATIALLACAVPARAAGYVIDEAGLLPAESVARIEKLSTELQNATDAKPQVAVLIVKDLGGRDIESYSADRFGKLGVGQADANNGILFVIAPAERKARIEVGYGLEGAVPDAMAGAILDEYVLPAFKAGDMAGGVEAGHRAIVAAVAREYGVSVAGITESDVPQVEETSSGDDSWIIGLFVLIFIIATIVSIIRRIFGGKNGGDSGGGWFGGWWDGGSGSGGGDSGGSFGGFGGGDSGGGGASGSW